MWRGTDKWAEGNSAVFNLTRSCNESDGSTHEDWTRNQHRKVFWKLPSHHLYYGAFCCSPVFNSIWIFKAALLCKALVSLPVICAHTIYKQRTRSGLVKLENLITWTQMVLVLPGALMEFQKPPWEIFCVIISGAVGPATFSSCCQKTKFIPLAILVWIWRDPSLELDATFDGPRCVGPPWIVFGLRKFIWSGKCVSRASLTAASARDVAIRRSLILKVSSVWWCVRFLFEQSLLISFPRCHNLSIVLYFLFK